MLQDQTAAIRRGRLNVESENMGEGCWKWAGDMVSRQWVTGRGKCRFWVLLTTMAMIYTIAAFVNVSAHSTVSVNRLLKKVWLKDLKINED